MKRIVIIILALLFAGCLKEETTIVQEMEEEEINPYERTIDLNEMFGFWLEVGPINGHLQWEWYALDMEKCSRHVIPFSIVKYTNESGEWESENVYARGNDCENKDSIVVEDYDNNSNPIYYEFHWSGRVVMHYSIKLP
jgi:hypothetical protein